MADLEIPADLVNLKRRFRAVEAELSQTAARMPTAAAIAGGEAEISEADLVAWNALRREQDEIVLAIHRHPAFEGLTQQQRYALHEGAAAAAR